MRLQVLCFLTQKLLQRGQHRAVHLGEFLTLFVATFAIFESKLKVERRIGWILALQHQLAVGQDVLCTMPFEQSQLDQAF